MQNYTIHELIESIESQIEKVRTITLTLASEFKTAANIIDKDFDHRQQWIDQLQTLHQSLFDITNGHPSLVVDKISQENVKKMIASIQDGF